MGLEILDFLHKIRKFLILLIVIFLLGFIIDISGNVSAQPSYSIPNWIRTVARWWSQGQVGEAELVNSASSGLLISLNYFDKIYV